MDFLLWAARSLHIFGVVVWVGGLMYQAAVAMAVARAEGTEFAPQTIHVVRRFAPFVWMCVWTVLVTGSALMLFSTRFTFFQFNDLWSVLLAMKQVTFLLMMVFSFGYARMFARVDEMMAKGTQPLDDVIPYHHRMIQFGRINIALGILALMFSAGMR